MVKCGLPEGGLALREPWEETLVFGNRGLHVRVGVGGGECTANGVPLWVGGRAEGRGRWDRAGPTLHVALAPLLRPGAH